MPSEIQNYKCPACTGPLHFAAASGKLECEYCGSIYEIEEMEAKYAAGAEAAVEASANKKADPEGWGPGAGMKAYSCPSCGAELVCDENTAASSCPYCGNPTVAPAQFADMLKPDYVIPFKKEKKEAKAALLQHYKGKALLPKSFVDGNHIEEIQGVYVPFWLYDGVCHGDMRYEGEEKERHSRGNEEIITHKYYDVHRVGDLEFEKIPADGSSRMPDTHMDSIEPYDYSEIKPFSMAYLPGYLADKYDVTKEECEDRFVTRAKDATKSAIRKSVEGYDSVKDRGGELNVKTTNVSYALMPVWLLSTKWNGQNYLFAMNGQTGKLTGDLPISKGKLCGFIFGIGIPLLIFGIILANLLEFDLLIGIFAPIVITALIAFGLVGSMKSVHTPSAAQYVTEKGLKLTVKTDEYVRTETERRTKNN